MSCCIDAESTLADLLTVEGICCQNSSSQEAWCTKERQDQVDRAEESPSCQESRGTETQSQHGEQAQDPCSCMDRFTSFMRLLLMLASGTCDCRDREGTWQDQIRTNHQGSGEVDRTSQENGTEESGCQEGRHAEEKGRGSSNRGIVGIGSSHFFYFGVCAERVGTAMLGVLGSRSRSLCGTFRRSLGIDSFDIMDGSWF